MHRDCAQCVVSFVERSYGNKSREFHVALCSVPDCCRRDIGAAIGDLTDRVVAERVRLEKGIEMTTEVQTVTDKEVGHVDATARPVRRAMILPPLKIRGLGDEVVRAKAMLGEVRSAMTDVGEAATALRQDLEDLKDQLLDHRDDIRFEAEKMGNSGNGSGEK